MKRFFLHLIFLLGTAGFLFAQPIGRLQRPAISVGPNYRIHPGNVTQTEVFITSHPSNQDILFASANTINFSPFFVSEGVYVSTDGGQSWSGSDTCTGPPIQFHGGDPGIAIDKNGTFILTRLGINPPFPGLYSHFSTDNGASWSAQKTITTDDMERAALASDAFPASLHSGRTYAVWVRFAPPYPIFFSFTDDGGGNWSAPAQINNPQKRGAGGDVAIGADGTVHVCWAGVAASSPFTEEITGYAASTDGGATWNVQESAFATLGIQGLLPEKQNIRVNGLPRIAVDNSGGPRQGWVYIVSAQKNLAPAGNDPDIILHRSTNGGQNWSPGIRVNQDPLNNGHIQYFPAIHVDGGGGINILYYDDRHTTSDSTGVFLSRSSDGGDTWSDYPVSDHNFEPVPIGGLGQGYQGDNIDLTSSGNTLWPVWMDNSSGIYQLWTAPIQIASLGGGEPGETPQPDEWELEQNFPNPFNGETTITYRLPAAADVRLELFDLGGKKVSTLSEGRRPAGTHRLRVDLETLHLPSGIYLYRFSAGKFSRSRAMIYIR